MENLENLTDIELLALITKALLRQFTGEMDCVKAAELLNLRIAEYGRRHMEGLTNE